MATDARSTDCADDALALAHIKRCAAKKDAADAWYEASRAESLWGSACIAYDKARAGKCDAEANAASSEAAAAKAARDNASIGAARSYRAFADKHDEYVAARAAYKALKNPIAE